MRNLPRSTVVLGLVLVGLICTLLGFAIARRSPEGSVQTRLAHQLVADFQNHVGTPSEHGVPLSTPGLLECILLLIIAAVGFALWRSWPHVSQQRSAKPRS